MACKLQNWPTLVMNQQKELMPCLCWMEVRSNRCGLQKLGVLECNTVSTNNSKPLHVKNTRKSWKVCCQVRLMERFWWELSNNYAASVVSYTTGIVNRTKSQLDSLQNDKESAGSIYGAFSWTDDLEKEGWWKSVRRAVVRQNTLLQCWRRRPRNL